MELYVHWWVFVKIGLFLLACIPWYMCYKKKFKSKFWIIVSIISLLLTVIGPVKIDPSNHRQVTTQSNIEIEEAKVMPPKVEDNSFKNRVDAVKSITKEDLK
jgi:hypothetical protein